jgi:hypothetical protein
VWKISATAAVNRVRDDREGRRDDGFGLRDDPSARRDTPNAALSTPLGRFATLQRDSNTAGGNSGSRGAAGWHVGGGGNDERAARNRLDRNGSHASAASGEVGACSDGAERAR